MPLPIEEWYYDVPVVTRTFVTSVVLVTLGCQLELISSLQLHYDYVLIDIRNLQYWRLITSFLYFGRFNLDFLFHLFFLVRYSRMLEEGSFRGRTADYFWMLFLGAITMLITTPFLPSKFSVPYLSFPLVFMLVYIWSRRNPYVRMNFLGLFNFNAPYLPWVLLGFTMLLNNMFPTGDLVGMGCGHVYYFLEDVYPRLGGGRRRGRVLETPEVVRRIFE
ncbi:Derlin, partial [Cladochytrium replicatum]